MQSTAIMKIMSMQSSFTPTENEISQFVIKNRDFVMTSTISDIAEKVGTSEASVNRFVRKIGFRGFNNFKIALAQNKFQEELIEESENVNVIESISNDYRQIVLSTSALIETEDVNQTVSLIKKSKVIHIVSLYNYRFAAEEFAYKLETTGFLVKTHFDTTDIHLTIPNLTQDDLVIVMAPSIQTRDLFPFVTEAKGRNITIIAITSHDFNKLDDVTDIRFITSDKNTARNSLTMSNTLMALFVSDIIYEALLRSDKNLRQKRMNSDTISSSNQVINHYYYDF